MSDMAAYVGDSLLNWIKGAAMVTAPSAVYVALYNGDPDASGTEVTGTVGLTRQEASFGAVAARAMSTDAEIDFGTASGAATVTHVVLFDAASAGNQLGKKSITSANVTSGEKVSIASGALGLSY